MSRPAGGEARAAAHGGGTGHVGAHAHSGGGGGNLRDR